MGKNFQRFATVNNLQNKRIYSIEIGKWRKRFDNNIVVFNQLTLYLIALSYKNTALSYFTLYNATKSV